MLVRLWWVIKKPFFKQNPHYYTTMLSSQTMHVKEGERIEGRRGERVREGRRGERIEGRERGEGERVEGGREEKGEREKGMWHYGFPCHPTPYCYYDCVVVLAEF